MVHVHARARNIDFIWHTCAATWIMCAMAKFSFVVHMRHGACVPHEFNGCGTHAPLEYVCHGISNGHGTHGPVEHVYHIILNTHGTHAPPYFSQRANFPNLFRRSRHQ